MLRFLASNPNVSVNTAEKKIYQDIVNFPWVRYWIENNDFSLLCKWSDRMWSTRFVFVFLIGSEDMFWVLDENCDKLFLKKIVEKLDFEWEKVGHIEKRCTFNGHFFRKSRMFYREKLFAVCNCRQYQIIFRSRK